MVSSKLHPSMIQIENKSDYFMTLKKGSRTVKTTGLVHNYIILANC